MSSEETTKKVDLDHKFHCEVATDYENEYDEKYIFCKCVAGEDGDKEIFDFKLISMPKDYHAQIWRVCEEEQLLGYKVYGGGLIKIDPKKVWCCK
jgi:hypothetical protein